MQVSINNKHVYHLALFIILALGAVSVNAATITSQLTGGNWGSGATWVGGNVPANGDIVVINGNVTINGNYTCRRLTINSGKTLAFSNGYTLTFANTNWHETCVTNNGTFTTTGGTIQLTGSGNRLYVVSNNTTTLNNVYASNVRLSFYSSSTVNGTVKLTNGAYINDGSDHPTYGSNATLEIAQTFSTNGNYYLWANSNGSSVAPKILISSGTVTVEEINCYLKKSLTVASGATLNAGKTCFFTESSFQDISNSGTLRLGGFSIQNGSTWTLNNDFTVSTVKILNGGTVNCGAYKLTIDNSLRNNCGSISGIMEMQNGGTFNAGTGTVEFKPAYYIDVNANNIAGGIVFNNVIVSGSNTLNIPNANTMSVNGNLTINSGATMNAPQNVNLGPQASVNNYGSVSNGSFPSGTPTAAVGNSGGGSINASRWTVTNPNTYTVTGNITFTGNPKTVIIQSGATLNTEGYTVTCDSVYINGTVNTKNSNGLAGTFGSAIVVMGGEATIVYDATSGTQTITPRQDYVNMELLNGAEKSFSAATYEISGDFSVNGAIPTFQNGTQIVFDGSTQSINSPNFNNVTFSNSGNKTLTTATSVYQTLTLAGNANLVTGGNLILISNASGTARIAAIPATAQITGNVTVQRFVPAVIRRSRMISPSVSNFTFSDLKDDIFVTGASGESNGFDASPQNSATVYTFQENTSGGRGWKAISNINNGLTPGVGALVFVRGDRTLSAPQWYTTPFVNQNEVIIDFTGTVNSGNISPTITYTNTGDATADGWNMVGNPYPSQISWNALTKNNLSTFYYTLNPVTGSYEANNGSSYIASGQGFFVQATGASPSLTFTESAKVDNAPTNYFKTNISPLKISMVKDNLNADVVWLDLKANGNKGFDNNEDALKMQNSVINLAFVLPNSTMVQYNTSSPISVSDTFTLNVNAANGTYNLSVEELGIIPAYQNIFLVDLATNNTINLRNAQTYTFSISNVAATKGNRFLIIVQDPAQLPVTLLNFIAKANNNDAQLTWSTASEKNNAGFAIERSTDNNNWQTIGFVAGAVNSNTLKQYNFTDADVFTQPVSSQFFYRLKQQDKNGKTALSNVVTVVSNKQIETNAVTIYPNPAINNLAVTFQLSANTTVSVYDLVGKLWISETSQNQTSAALNIAHLPSGIYHLTVSNTEGFNYTQKFIKK